MDSTLAIPSAVSINASRPISCSMPFDCVICETMNDDGTMARMPQLEDFSSEHGVGLVSVSQIIAYRRRHERLVQQVADARTTASPEINNTLTPSVD